MDNSFHRTVGKCDEHKLIALMQEEYASFKELRNCKCLKQKTLYFTLFMLILGYTSIKFHVTGGDSGFCTVTYYFYCVAPSLGMNSVAWMVQSSSIQLQINSSRVFCQNL